MRFGYGLIAGLVLWALGSPTNQQPQSQPGKRLHLMTQNSADRLEDIQESADHLRLITHDRGFAPRLWDRKSMRLLKLLGEQKDAVRAVTFSPDGKRILTVSASEIRLWDSLKGNVQAKVSAEGEDLFTTASFSPDGSRVVVGTVMGNVVSVSTTDTSKEQKLAAVGRINHFDFSSDSTRFVSSHESGDANVWDSATGKLLAHVTPSNSPVLWSSLNADGSLVCCTSYDDMARVYELPSGRLLYEKKHQIGPKGFLQNTLMAALFVGPNRSELLVAGEDGTMSLLNPRTGEKEGELKGHTAAIREIRRTNDGLRVATYGDDEQLKVWDVVKHTELPITRFDDGETAGEFSPDGQLFWLGYQNGNIREHDLNSGTVKTAMFNSVAPIEGVTFTALGDLAVESETYTSMWNTANLNEQYFMPYSWRPTVVSPDGTRGVSFAGDEFGGHIYDLVKRKWIKGYKNIADAQFSADGSRLMMRDQGAGHFIYDRDGNQLYGWEFKGSKNVRDTAFSPKGDLLLTTWEDAGYLSLWNAETGAVLYELKPEVGELRTPSFSPDQKFAMAVGADGFVVWSTADGSVLFSLREKLPASGYRIYWSPDSKFAFVCSPYKGLVLNTGNWSVIWRSPAVNWKSDDFSKRFSPDGKRFIVPVKNRLELWNVDDPKTPERTLELDDYIQQASFTPDGKQLMTVDHTDGLVLWNPENGAKLGNLIALKKGGWMAVDSAGRFDASNPSDVDGAHFVLEWSGGLEPIDLEQLKEQYYEPGLFQKLLGKSNEPTRSVPNLDELKLFPEVKLTRSASDQSKVNVSLKGRDDGGIGQVTVYLNGKELLKKSGAGYFSLDLSTYNQFLLPEIYLPKGQGNLLQVQASNSRGDLTSPPVTLDLGVPQGLKPPEINFYALFVGVSDYVGDAGDLKAAADDAKVLSKAVTDVAEKLLPGRVHSTLLASGLDATQRPTRAAVMQWFGDVAKKSTSSDIVLVFFAGHGTNKVADQSGYYFITADADPTDLGALSIGKTTVSGDDLRQELSKIAAGKQVVILDTCHSGAASTDLIGEGRSLSGDYQRSWESIKDSTGTWLLAGAAADQLSYESSNVEHGMLTYALLEAIDKASPEGLREGSSGELFVDVERWLNYAANRVESLKNEVGLRGVQRPEFKRARSASSFDIGVTSTDHRGFIGLHPPMPIVIMGDFQLDQEDPAALEPAVAAEFKTSTQVKAWFDIAKHPNAYRAAGSYSIEGAEIAVKVYLQQFDEKLGRKTLETFELRAPVGEMKKLASSIREGIESRILKRERGKSG